MDTRKTLRVDGSTLHGVDNHNIIGDNNVINGNNNIVFGNLNVVRGFNNVIHGQGNTERIPNVSDMQILLDHMWLITGNIREGLNQTFLIGLIEFGVSDQRRNVLLSFIKNEKNSYDYRLSVVKDEIRFGTHDSSWVSPFKDEVQVYKWFEKQIPTYNPYGLVDDQHQHFLEHVLGPVFVDILLQREVNEIYALKEDWLLRAKKLKALMVDNSAGPLSSGVANRVDDLISSHMSETIESDCEKMHQTFLLHVLGKYVMDEEDLNRIIVKQITWYQRANMLKYLADKSRHWWFTKQIYDYEIFHNNWKQERLTLCGQMTRYPSYNLNAISKVINNQKTDISYAQIPVLHEDTKKKERVPSLDDCLEDVHLPEDVPENVKSCAVCLSAVPNCIVFPCMHKCICCTCARELDKKEKLMCPICGVEAKKIRRVFE